MIIIRLMITPISIMPSVEPISETPSAAGVGVICNEMDVPVFCVDAKDGVMFASTRRSTRAMNKRAMLKIRFGFIFC